MPAKPNSNTSDQPADTTQPVAAPAPAPLSHSEFIEHMREQARVGLRTLLESLMEEELSALLGAKWGEHTAARVGYRNGYYQRDLLTTTGPLEKLKVPRDREGRCHLELCVTP